MQNKGIKFFKIDSINHLYFKECLGIINQSFISDEIREFDKDLLSKNNYCFNAIIINKSVVGVIANWEFKEFVFIEHIAIHKRYRGKGIGTKVIKKILQDNFGKIFILEVERPSTEEAVKRIKFYEKLGYKLNEFDYIQPAYSIDKACVPMFIMSYPNKISNEQFESIKEVLYKLVYKL